MLADQISPTQSMSHDGVCRTTESVARRDDFVQTEGDEVLKPVLGVVRFGVLLHLGIEL